VEGNEELQLLQLAFLPSKETPASRTPVITFAAWCKEFVSLRTVTSITATKYYYTKVGITEYFLAACFR
jgi:hypothetical protein